MGVLGYRLGVVGQVAAQVLEQGAATCPGYREPSHPIRYPNTPICAAMIAIVVSDDDQAQYPFKN